MDPSCLEFSLTDDESEAFDRDGYLIIEEALSPDQVDLLNGVLDRFVERDMITHAGVRRSKGRLNIIDIAGRDPAILDLVDHPRILPKVWGILGWNIHLYHSHYIIGAPGEATPGAPSKMLRFHQDSGRINIDIETDPRPRISLKVGYLLSDASQPGCGNMWVVPGSHLRNTLDPPASGQSQPEGARPIQAPAGAAVIFDRRLWHAGSPNLVPVARRALFYGYAYRWVHTRDEMTIPPEFYEAADPIRKQILDFAPTQMGRTSPEDDDVPLKTWLEQYDPAMVAK